MSLSPTDLIAFETSIADAFNRGEIRAPVHLTSGNEEQLIEYFKGVQVADWVCCQWRSHYHCLLKGVPEAELRAEIMAGRSISLCFPKARVISSAIAGGILPIAVGIAMGIKRAGGTERVHAFVGDMMSMSGIFHECVVYSHNFDLPIRFVVENNGISVCSDTNKTWGSSGDIVGHISPNVSIYRYESKYPHSGAGTRIQF